MAFRASNILPEQGYDRAKKLAVQIKRLAEARSISFASGATSAEVLSVADNLGALKAGLDEAKTIPGIAAYAQGQEDDVTYDVAAEFSAVLVAVDAVIANIVATIPTDASGWLLINKINADGTLTARSFTGAQLAGLRTVLDALAAIIS